MKLLSVTLPYLLLVTFYTAELGDFGTDKMNAIVSSPYNGVAVPLIGAYDTGKHTAEDFAPSVKRLKDGARKDVWPWVFFNRFVGSKEGARSLSPDSGNAYFRAISGMDIYNEAGALGDFYGIWKTSLAIARETGSPGIVVDPEAYNNYETYKVSYISEETGIPENEVKKRLAEIGRELARIADETYPGRDPVVPLHRARHAAEDSQPTCGQGVQVGHVYSRGDARLREGEGVGVQAYQRRRCFPSDIAANPWEI